MSDYPFRLVDYAQPGPLADPELLVWLRILALAVGTYPEKLDRDLSRLPYLGVLLKDHQDIEDLEAGRNRP